MKFHLAIFALASGLVGALEDCGGSPCTPTCDPLELPQPCNDSAPDCLVVSACDSEDYICVFTTSLECLVEACSPGTVGTTVLSALLEYTSCACTEEKSPKRLGGKGSSAKRLGGSSAAKRLNGTSSSAAA